MAKTLTRMLFIVFLAVLVITGCDTTSTGSITEDRTLHIVSGSENQTLEPIIQTWASDNGYAVNMTYMGTVDIARMLQSGQVSYDAVWPANRLWIDYGDTHNLTKHVQSIMRSPVVFGVKRSIAERLGWIGEDIYMDDIVTATESGEIRFMMTSATQSNSGASFYFAALTAFAEKSGDVITSDDLESANVEADIKRILGTVDRSSGSSGWLKDLFLDQYERYDAMVNYEALIIEANQELEQAGHEPLYAIYPVDGLAIADSPLGYVERNIEGKEDIFLELQQYLLTEDVQRELLNAGRRTSTLGIQLTDANRDVFRPEWGIDVDRVIQPIRFPNAEVIQQALDLYQTSFRRPSCTVYVLDFSGSMSGQGEADLKAAMRTLLDQSIATQYLLQGHPKDVSSVVLFNDTIINGNRLDQWTVEGNDEAELRNLYLQIERTQAGNGTDIFNAALAGLEHLEEIRTQECLPSVILMTDGRDGGNGYSAFQSYVRQSENDVPVFAITFGDADPEQLRPATTLTSARIFDGTSDLVSAFRSAKGYN
ncbi:MAG: substrate-binding domain-containing protein [Anaerolineae bacterium]|nr:substrate-binding domain-containing protein [Anaerolineae bacterium]